MAFQSATIVKELGTNNGSKVLGEGEVADGKLELFEWGIETASSNKTVRKDKLTQIF